MLRTAIAEAVVKWGSTRKVQASTFKMFLPVLIFWRKRSWLAFPSSAASFNLREFLELPDHNEYRKSCDDPHGLLNENLKTFVMFLVKLQVVVHIHSLTLHTGSVDCAHCFLLHTQCLSGDSIEEAKHYGPVFLNLVHPDCGAPSLVECHP